MAHSTETEEELPANPRLWGWRGVAVAGALVLVMAAILIGLWRTGVMEPPASIGSILGIEPPSLKVVLVTPPGEEDDEFREGAFLAMNEVNAGGGIGGLPMTIKIINEDAYTDAAKLERVVADSLLLADRVVSEPNLLAVLGHWSSATALPASSVYDRHGVLYLASHATAASLTNHGFDQVFALQPNNADNAAMMAHYALSQGLRRFIVLSDDTDYGTETTNLFSSWVSQGGGEVILDTSLTSYGRSIDRLLLFILDNRVFTKEDIDAFFIVSSSVLDTARFIRRARELGLAMPILGAEAIFSRRIESYVGKERMKGVAGVSLYNENSTAPAAQAFVSGFNKTYGALPDQMASIGYDAVKLLDYAVEKSGTRDPVKLADWLRIMRHEKPFIGATGPLVFDARGLVTDTEAYIVRHDGTQFRTVASYQKPLDWDPVGMARDVSAPMDPSTPEDPNPPQETQPNETVPAPEDVPGR